MSRVAQSDRVGRLYLAALHYAYSTGERSGYVQKISRRGWVCKTWEGELAMTTVPGTAPRILEFSVRDDAVARQIGQAAGHRAELSAAPGSPHVVLRSD
jgi:hypothetical protein